jgi:hypothetical protein
MKTLDDHTRNELARPFTVNAVKFKPQTVTKDQTKAMATFHVDARLVAARLNAIVGADGWHDTYRVLFEMDARSHASFHFPVECALTVLGVTKTDVGVHALAAPDGNAVKSAYSDALKRAAVKFGVGAYLYALPKVWAQTKTYQASGGQTKVNGFSPAGETEIKKMYDKWLRSPQNVWGDALDHGDVGDDPDTLEHANGEPTPDGEAKARRGVEDQVAMMTAAYEALSSETRKALGTAFEEARQQPMSKARTIAWLVEEYPHRMDDLATLAEDLSIPFGVEA